MKMPADLRDKTFLHLGKRLTDNVPRLAVRTDGVVLTAEHTGPIYEALRRSGSRLLFQEPGSLYGSPPTLFSVEELWLSAQVGSVAAYTNPVLYLPSPKEKPREARARLALAERGATLFRQMVEQHIGNVGVLTLFAFHHHWLAEGRHSLAAMLRDIEGPVGLMVSHSADPFASPTQVEGMLELVREFQVSVLRTDTAGLGFRAHGAPMTSIGIGTGTRHYPPADHVPFANLDDDSPRLFVPAFGDFWRGTRIAQASPDEAFRCFCGVCGGLPLSRFLDPNTKPEAAEHTVDSWMTLALQLESVPISRRPDWWTSYLLGAIAALRDFEDRTYSVEAESRQILAWTRALGVTTS